jgi:hypothetical protein
MMWLYSDGSSFNRSFVWFLASIKGIITSYDFANYPSIIVLSSRHASSAIWMMAFEKALEEGGPFLSSSRSFSTVASLNSAAISGLSSLCRAMLGLLRFGGAVFFLCPNLSFSTRLGHCRCWVLSTVVLCIGLDCM